MPKRLPVHGLDPAGGADGQVPVLSGGKFVIGTPATGSALGWYNVKNYGPCGATATATQNRTAFNAAIAALNTAGRGTLYMPADVYDFTGAGVLTPITAHAVVRGDGGGDLQAQNAATSLKYTAATGYLMTLSNDGIIAEDFGLENPTTTTQTAGAGIRVTQGDANRYRNITVRGFYDCISIEDGAVWTMEGCWLVGPVRYGLYIRHIDLPDGGDQALYGCFFYAEDRNAAAAIRYESGGGLKMSACKVNTLYGTGFWGIGLDATITGVTGVMTIYGNSFENITGPAIRGQKSGGGSFQECAIGVNQFGYYGSGSYSAIDITDWKDVTVVGNTGLASTSSGPMVKFTNVTGGFVGANTSTGFASEYAGGGTTSGVKTLLSSARQILAGTGLTGGGDLSADRTLAIDATAEAERIRDVIGAALVQGAGIVLTINDAADTITIAATATGSGTAGEVLMADGVTGPPVPIETESRDDWLYQG